MSREPLSRINHVICDSDDNGSELVAISEIYIHPSYDSVTGAHDLAVVETHEEIPFSAKVGPACLPFKHIDKNFVGETVKVLGTYDDLCTPVCYAVLTFVVAAETCSRHYRHAFRRLGHCGFCRPRVRVPSQFGARGGARVPVRGQIQKQFRNQQPVRVLLAQREHLSSGLGRTASLDRSDHRKAEHYRRGQQ